MFFYGFIVVSIFFIALSDGLKVFALFFLKTAPSLADSDIIITRWPQLHPAETQRRNSALVSRHLE